MGRRRDDIIHARSGSSGEIERRFVGEHSAYHNGRHTGALPPGFRPLLLLLQKEETPAEAMPQTEALYPRSAGTTRTARATRTRGSACKY